MEKPNALVHLQGAIEIYVNTHSCYDGMPEPNPHARIAIWMYRWEWNDIRDRIAALEAERNAQADQAATYRKRCREYADQLFALEAELKEEQVLNAKGSEREAALMGKVSRLEAENAKLMDGLHNARYCLRRAAPLIFTNYPQLADDLSVVADRIDSIVAKRPGEKGGQ